MSNPVVRLLHISDIHRGPNEPVTSLSLRGRLLTDIRRTYVENNGQLGADEPKLAQPDIIVVSGDLTQRAAPAEFDEARKFLTGLLPLVDDDPERVVIVPGNHDLDWGIAAESFTPSSEKAYHEQREYHSPYRQTVKRAADGSFWEKNEATYTRRFRPFKDFFDSFYEGRYEYSLERGEMFTVYDFREQFGLVIVGFNSCDEIDAYRGDGGQLHLLDNRAFINSDAVYRAIDHPAFVDLKGAMLVGVFHHNTRSVNHGPDFVDESCIQTLRQQGFELCLHGHVHDASNDSFYDQIQDRRLPVVGAGSLAAPYRDRPPAAPQGYNLAVIDRESGGIWVHTRRSDERTQVWTPDYRWQGKPYFQIRPPRPPAPEPAAPPPDPAATPRAGAGIAAVKAVGSIINKLGRKGRGLPELLGAYRDLLLGTISRVRLFGQEEARELRQVFVTLSIVEEYGGLPGDRKFLGLIDADLRRRLSLSAVNSLEADGPDGGGGRTRSVTPGALLRAGRRAAITGAPGCGKTTLLKYLALQTALTEPDRWPVFLELKTVRAKDLEAAEDLPDLLFAKAIAARLKLSEAERETLGTHFRAQLLAGEVSLYLDGLDEVRLQSIFGDLCTSVSDFAASADYKGNTLILSSRPFGLHRATLEGLEQMEIQPLEPRQIEAFLKSYYPDDEAARRLRHDLRRPGELRELARSPVMLSAIAELYRGGDAPGEVSNRLDIYEKIARRLVAHLDREKNVRRFSFRLDDPEGTLKLDFLERLAFERLLLDANDTGTEASRFVFSAEDILEKAKAFVRDWDLRDVAPHALADDAKATPLLREVSENGYAFAHTTLQEYLAAKALARRDDGAEILCRAYFNPTLVAQEVLPMALGLSRRADALYEALEGLPESLTYTNLRLRARGLCYGAGVGERRFTELLDRLLRMLVDPSNQEESYRRALLNNLWFLGGNARAYLEERIIPHLRDTSSFGNLHAAEALRVLGGERSFDPLVRALNPREGGGLFVSRMSISSGLDDSLVRNVARALIRIDPRRAVPVLAAIHTSYSYGDLDRLLKQVGTEEAYRALLARRRRGLDWQGSRWAEEASRSQGGSVTELLVAALAHPDAGIRGTAVETLGYIGLEEFSPPVAALLRDPDFAVRWKAAQALEKIGSDKAVGQLLEALRDPASTVRWCAAAALGQIKSEDAVAGLIAALGDPDDEVKSQAASALGWIGSERAAEPLIGLLTGGGNPKPRSSAAYALYSIRSGKAVEPLIGCLTDVSKDVRAGAAFALGATRSAQAVGPLIARLTDEAGEVRGAAASALGKIGAAEAAPHLISLVRRDQDHRAREWAMEALGAIGSEESVETLLVAYTSTLYVHYAADAIAKSDVKALAAALPQLLRHENKLVRENVARTVGYYCDGAAVAADLARLAESDPEERVRAAARAGAIEYERKLALFRRTAGKSAAGD